MERLIYCSQISLSLSCVVQTAAFDWIDLYWAMKGITDSLLVWQWIDLVTYLGISYKPCKVYSKEEKLVFSFLKCKIDCPALHYSLHQVIMDYFKSLQRHNYMLHELKEKGLHFVVLIIGKNGCFEPKTSL